MTILITRPIKDAQDTAHILSQAGYQSLICPFLEIVQFPFDISEAQDADGLIITSRNAVRSLPKTGINPAKKMYVVGQGTAELAEKQGFTNITIAEGDIESLIEILQEKEPQKLLYLRGKHVRHDLSTLRFHHNITDIVVYEAKKITEIAKEQVALLANPEIDYILFASARTVDAFDKALANCKKQEEIRNNIMRTTGLFFSDRVLQSADHMNFKRKIVLESPDIQAVLKILEKESRL